MVCITVRQQWATTNGRILTGSLCCFETFAKPIDNHSGHNLIPEWQIKHLELERRFDCFILTTYFVIPALPRIISKDQLD